MFKILRMKNIDLTKLRIILCVLCILCSEIIFSGCKKEDKHPAVNIGSDAPMFALTDLNKNTVSLGDYKGKKVILNFWATWCPPCVNEMPLLQEVYNNRKGEGIEVIGINYNEDYERVKKFISEKGVAFTILIDSDLKVSMDYGVIGLPVTFFIDRDGIIKEKFKGELNKKLIEDILNRF
jgi:DsbE subfamily thiol:disulfide oxidoreductase